MEATVEVTAEVTVDNVLPIAVLDSGDPFNASLEGYSPLFVSAATFAAARTAPYRELPRHSAMHSCSQSGKPPLSRTLRRRQLMVVSEF